MNCLILAAGSGSRLRTLSESKPLAPVCGRPLIEHVIDRAARGGASTFLVVTGHQADRLEAFLAAVPDRLGLPVRWVRAADWTRPNGHSVLAGAAGLDGRFLLLMADHLFDPAIPAGLVAQASDAPGLTLAIDRRIDGPLVDLDDATRVAIGADGRIARIGKGIAPFDAIDTGIFLADPSLADALRAAISAGAAGSLSDGVQQLAAKGLARTWDIGDRWWIDVDDPRMHALAEQQLREGS